MTAPPSDLLPSHSPWGKVRRDKAQRRCRGSRVLLGVVGAALLLAPGLPSASAAIDGCANAALRAQTNSAGLPDCRAYERVTPVYTEGFTFTPMMFSDDGVVSYYSTGNFADNPMGIPFNQYIAQRSAKGWVNSSQNPPGDVYGTLGSEVGADAQSADLLRSVWLSRTFDRPVGVADYWLRDADGSLRRIGPGVVGDGYNERPFTLAASADLSHVLFSRWPSSGSQVTAALWEFAGLGNQGPPRAVSVDNTGAQTQGEACPGRMSVDGRVVAFSSGCRQTGVLRVWARVGGSATVAVSGSECARGPSDLSGACNGLSDAQFVGAAADGSRVFFTTSQQLVDGDTDQSRDLYACDIPAGSPEPEGTANSCVTLTEVSGAATGSDVEP